MYPLELKIKTNIIFFLKKQRVAELVKETHRWGFVDLRGCQYCIVRRRNWYSGGADTLITHAKWTTYISKLKGLVVNVSGIDGGPHI
jgi:hypothetical protein